MNPLRCLRRAAGPAFLLGLAGAAFAQTIYVDTSDDVVDFGGAQQVADLPGPDGRISLAEAGLASDNTPGVQIIGFHVPQGEWLYQQFYPGRAVLRPFLGFRVFDTVILDATTQTAFTGDTNPDGGEVVIWANSYLIDNVGSRVLGFDHSSFDLSGGSGNVVQGNSVTSILVYDSASNLIGGANPGEGNTGAVIQIDRANDNVVLGNTVDRVRVLGWFGGGMPATNNRIGGPSPTERNHISGLGTLNSEGIPGGYAVQLFDSIGTIVENNWIGMTPDGLDSGHPYCTIGIWLDSENQDTTIRDNRIAGIRATAVPPHGPAFEVGSAVVLSGTGSGVTIVGNKIGLNADDLPVLGSVEGISTYNYYLGPTQGVVIGGPAPGEGNEVAGHLQTAIRVANTYQDLRISGNSIHDNGGLGIDLVTDALATGVTANDFLDGDTGGNGLQNHPVIAQAVNAGSALRVSGALDSSPLDGFTVELFASAVCDPSGFGEAQLFLGRTAVTTDASGHATFDVLLPGGLPPSWVVVATATLEPLGATSELSACVPIADGSTGASFCAGDGTETTACPCGNFGLSGHGCDNAQGTGGVQLAATGDPALNDVVLLGAGFPPAGAPTVVAIRSLAREVPPAVFGDGLRCLATAGLVRVGATTASAGTSALALNHAAGAGTFHYQLWYRNSPASFCNPAAAFNLSNGLSLVWP